MSEKSGKRWVTAMAISLIVINNLESFAQTLSINKTVLFLMSTLLIVYIEEAKDVIQEFK